MLDSEESPTLGGFGIMMVERVGAGGSVREQARMENLHAAKNMCIRSTMSAFRTTIHAKA